MTSKHLEPATVVASVFAEVVVDRHFQGNCLTVQVQDDGSVKFHDKGAKDALALDIGRAIIGHGKLEIAVADYGDKSLYVTTWIAVAQYSPPAQFAPAEPAPAPAPSMPPISELRDQARREQRAKRRFEAGKIASLMRKAASELADADDFEGAHMLLFHALEMMLAANYEEGEL